jgi:lipopolysaccharide/colanic/teichoic acid biosynthesis glycosyltransferase
MVAQNASYPRAGVPAAGRPAPEPARIGSGRVKRACDLGISLALLLPALPVIAAAWVLVRLTSAGPGFYSQVRVGLNGRHYRIYKIRSMTHNCEAASGAKWCTKNDARVTPVGRILRKLHIDELPQLVNVLKGDMSLVGPRPERPEFVGPLSQALPGYAERHRVRPGVTGLAQIQLPPDTDVESVRRKLVLDRCYARRAGFWLDLRILLGTALYLAGFSYDRVRRVVRLPNPPADGPAAGPRPVARADRVTDDTGTQPALTEFAEPVRCGKAE